MRPTLFFEFVGSERGVEEQMETVRWCLEEANVLNSSGTADAEERAALWKARHMAYYASMYCQMYCHARPFILLLLIWIRENENVPPLSHGGGARLVRMLF